MKLLGFIGSASALAIAGAAGFDASDWFPAGFFTPPLKEAGPGPAIPACIVGPNGCVLTHSIYREGISFWKDCDPMMGMDYINFFYYCDRYQCTNGHYYVISTYYPTSCSWGPLTNVPPTCPNNSCVPPPTPW